MASKFVGLVFLFITASLFILGAIGDFTYNSFFFAVFLAILSFGIGLTRGKKFKIPDFLGIYCVFILTLLVHFFIFAGQLLYLWLFLTGGIIWLIAYNFRDFVLKYFFALLLILGFSMLGFYFYSSFKGIEYFNQNLFHSISPEFKHNHLGDLWAIVLTALVYNMSMKTRVWHYLLFTVSLLVIALSFSRSALISLLAGTIAIFSGKAYKLKNVKLFSALLIIFALIFFYFGFTKNIFSSRPYYFEALLLVLKHPFGIGMGNFYRFTNSNATITFNLILEVILGLGIFSLPFIIWLVKIMKSVYSGNTDKLFKATFSAVFVNFMLDATYVIPTMLWLFFMSLALLENDAHETKTV